MIIISHYNNKYPVVSGSFGRSQMMLYAGKLLWLFLLVFALSGEGVAHDDNSGTKNLSLTGVNLSVRALLQGPYDANSGLMNSQLQARSLLPVAQPYSAAPFSYSGTERLSADVLSATDQDAVVDWVLLELRNAGSQNDLVAQKAVVLQADGDLVDAASGETALNFPTVSEGHYRVSIKHRNHQGVVTASTFHLRATEVAFIDFSSPAVQMQGEHARVLAGGFALLRGGDANHDGRLIAVGAGNDSNPLLGGILVAEGNTGANASFQQQGYLVTDLNLDGRVVYTGPSNDNNLLIGNVLLHPGNVSAAANFIVGANIAH